MAITATRTQSEDKTNREAASEAYSLTGEARGRDLHDPILVTESCKSSPKATGGV
jgi:hypothetical protein